MWDWFMCLKVECGVIESTYHENHCNRIFRQFIPQGALYFIASITLLPSAIHQAAFLLFFFQACVTVIWLFKILNVHYLRCLVNCFSHLTNDQFPQTFWLHLVSKIKGYILCTQYLFTSLLSPDEPMICGFQNTSIIYDLYQIWGFSSYVYYP